MFFFFTKTLMWSTTWKYVNNVTTLHLSKICVHRSNLNELFSCFLEGFSAFDHPCWSLGRTTAFDYSCWSVGRTVSCFEHRISGEFKFKLIWRKIQTNWTVLLHFLMLYFNFYLLVSQFVFYFIILFQGVVQGPNEVPGPRTERSYSTSSSSLLVTLIFSLSLSCS
jgi:hypothetical protein